MLTALANVGMVVSSRFNVLGGRFGAIHVEMKHLPNAPLLSTYKRRLPSPHFNNTQEKKSTKEQEQEHHSMGLGPSWLEQSSRERCEGEFREEPNLSVSPLVYLDEHRLFTSMGILVSVHGSFGYKSLLIS